MNASRFQNSERGESSMSVLTGMVIGTLVLGPFAIFSIAASASADRSVERSETAADFTTALNRIGRDVNEAAEIELLTPSELVLNNGPGLIRWAVDEAGVLSSQHAEGETVDWDSVPANPIAHDVDQRVFAVDPAPAIKPLIDITLTSADGSYELVTSASLGR